MFAITAAFIVASCSGSDSAGGKVERFVSDDVDIVFTGDIHRLIEATGSTVEKGAVKPSETINDIISTMGGSQSSDIEDFLSFKGIDWSNALVAIKAKKDFEKPDVLIVWSVTDEKEFAKAFVDQVDNDLDIDEEDGYVTVGDKKGSIVLKDKLAMFVIKGGEPMKASRAISAIGNWEENASEKPLAGWKKDKLAADHILNMLMDTRFVKKAISENEYQMRAFEAQFPEAKKSLDKVLKGVVMGYFDIDGQTASAEVNLYDQDGNDLVLYKGGTIDAGMLKYGNSSDVFVGAFGDTKTAVEMVKKNIPAFNSSEQAQLFNTLLGNLQGTAMIMAGPNTSDLNALDDIEGWNITGVVGYKDGSAAGQALDLLAQYGEMADLRISSHSPGKSVVLKSVRRDYSNAVFDYDTYEYVGIQEIETPFYLKVDGKNLVVSNANIAGKGAPISADLIDGAISAIAFDLKKDNNLLSAFNVPFGAKGYIVSKGNGAKANITLTGTDKDFLVAIMDLIGSNL